MQVVYTLSNNNETDDWELRVSMRSWARHYGQLTGFVILGEVPAWLQTTHPQITHIPFPDNWKKNKDANLIAKLAYYAALHPDQEWIYCSDDQFLLRPITDQATSDHAFRPWQAGKIKKHSNTKFRRRLWNTRLFLKTQGIEDTHHYDCHIPYKLHSTQVLQALRANYGETPVGGFANTPGYTIMSLIFGLAQISNPPHIRAERIRCYFNRTAPGSKKKIMERLGENYFLSLSENGLTGKVREVLDTLYSAPGHWELS